MLKLSLAIFKHLIGQKTNVFVMLFSTLSVPDASPTSDVTSDRTHRQPYCTSLSDPDTLPAPTVAAVRGT